MSVRMNESATVDGSSVMRRISACERYHWNCCRFVCGERSCVKTARGCSAPPEVPTPDDNVSPGVEVVGFADTYLGNSWDQAACDTTYGMVGFEPADGDGYPVFVFTHGSYGDYQDLYTDAHIEAMAKKGFVAVSIAYDNDLFGLGCDELDKKAIDAAIKGTLAEGHRFVITDTSNLELPGR